MLRDFEDFGPDKLLLFWLQLRFLGILCGYPRRAVFIWLYVLEGSKEKRELAPNMGLLISVISLNLAIEPIRSKYSLRWNSLYVKHFRVILRIHLTYLSWLVELYFYNLSVVEGYKESEDIKIIRYFTQTVPSLGKFRETKNTNLYFSTTFPGQCAGCFFCIFTKIF